MSNLQLDWIDAIIRENDQISVTKRIVPSLSPDGSFSIDPERNSVIGYHITCKAHRTMIEVDAQAAQRINDSRFCAKCRDDAPATPRKLAPETKALMARLVHEQLSQSMTDYLESLIYD